jgi:hypothetical protein
VEILGSIGVAILLAAFFANLTGRLEASSRVYQGMNALGAAIAAWASLWYRIRTFRRTRGDLVCRCARLADEAAPQFFREHLTPESDSTRSAS